MRKLNKMVSFLVTAAALFLVSPTMVLAADTTIDLTPQGDFAGLSKITIPNLISGGINLVLAAAAIVFFFVLVIGGIQWIVSGGDKTGAETARKRVTAALVGLAIVFVAWAIGSLFQSLFGIKIFQPVIKSF